MADAPRLKFEEEVTIRVAWPEIDGLKVHQVTAVTPDGHVIHLHILSAVRPIKLSKRKKD